MSESPEFSGTRSTSGTTVSSKPRPLFPNSWIALGLLLLVALSAIPLVLQTQKSVHEKELRILQADRLRKLGLALRLATSQPGRSNDTVGALRQIAQSELLLDPVSGRPFLISQPLPDASQPGAIIAYAPAVTGKGGVCLFGDGSVAQVSAAQATQSFGGFLPVVPVRGPEANR